MRFLTKKTTFNWKTDPILQKGLVEIYFLKKFQIDISYTVAVVTENVIFLATFFDYI